MRAWVAVLVVVSAAALAKPKPVNLLESLQQLGKKLEPRTAIEAQTAPDVVPRDDPPATGCSEPQVRGGPPMPYRSKVTEADFPPRKLLQLPPKTIDKEVFLGREVGGRREGPYVVYVGLSEYHYEEWATTTVREGAWTNGVKGTEEREYVSGVFTRTFTSAPGSDEAEAIARCGAVVTSRTHYRRGRKHGLEEQFHPDGHKLMEASWNDGVQVGTLRWWHSDGSLAEETTFNDRGLVVTSKKWSRGVLVLDVHDGVRVTRFANGFKESEVLPADGQFYGVRRVWFENGKPRLSVDVNAGGFQVGTARHWAEDGREIPAAEWAAHARDEANRKSMELLGNLAMLPFSVLCALK